MKATGIKFMDPVRPGRQVGELDPTRHHHPKWPRIYAKRNESTQDRGRVEQMGPKSKLNAAN